jgi:DNA-binding response OmpR family regulator
MDILIADDNRDVAHSLARLLRMRGHRVSIAYAGKDAIEAVTSKLGAIILDVGLPDMSGYEVARAIRARMPSALIIAFSGHGSEDDRRRAHEASIDAYLTKPVLLADLEAALRGASGK